MIPTSGLNEVGEFAPGWIGRYCSVVGMNKFPPSYHLLSGLFALGVGVGRRAAVHRGPVVLWPPQSIVLLGPSAIGKSQSLYLAGRLLETFALDPWENEAGRHEYRKGFMLTEQGFTPRGLMEEWYRVQVQQQADSLEGAHIETEMAKVIHPNKKGSEGVNTWIISALEHRDLRDLTGMYGKRHIRNITVAFAFASTLQYLRKALDADEFAGGLMHRFLITYERQTNPAHEPQRPDQLEMQRLAEELRQLHDHSPKELVLPPKVKSYIDRVDRQQKFFRHHQLAGFWGRLADLTLKVAQLFTLAQHASEITMEEVERAEALLRYRLSPVLAGLVEELDAPPEYKKMLDLADSLETTGPAGWPVDEFLRRTGKADPKQAQGLLAAMIQAKLAFKRGARVYGKEAWVPDAAPDE